jgi:hypothetical protein
MRPHVQYSTNKTGEVMTLNEMKSRSNAQKERDVATAANGMTKQTALTVDQ